MLIYKKTTIEQNLKSKRNEQKRYNMKIFISFCLKR